MWLPSPPAPLRRIRKKSALGGAVAGSIDPTALGEEDRQAPLLIISRRSQQECEGFTPDTYIPLEAITKWYDNFLGKVKAKRNWVPRTR